MEAPSFIGSAHIEHDVCEACLLLVDSGERTAYRGVISRTAGRDGGQHDAEFKAATITNVSAAAAPLRPSATGSRVNAAAPAAPAAPLLLQSSCGRVCSGEEPTGVAEVSVSFATISPN